MDILLIAALTFLGGLGFLLIQNGLLRPIRFETQEVAAMEIAYRLHVGDYAASSKSMDTVCRLLAEEGIENITEFGLFYDNPSTTPKEQLRSLVGCIIREGASSVTPEHIKRSHLPASVAPVAAFPYRNTFSIALGAVKVYTALAKYRTANAIPETPVMEIYDRQNGQILYVLMSGWERTVLEDLAKAA